MEYTMTQVRNVLRNYEDLLVRRRGDHAGEVSSKQTVVTDDVQISTEGLRRLVELQQTRTDNGFMDN